MTSVCIWKHLILLLTCMNRTNSNVTCSDIGIKLLYRIIKVSRLYPKFLLNISEKGVYE